MSNELYARLLEAQWQSPMTIVPPPTWHQLAKQLLRIPPKPVVAISKSELKKLIIEQIQTYGTACDLNHIDVSNRHDMMGVFSTLPFNGDVSKWNVSRVISMESMFAHCPFDGDISQWDVANVTTMRGMFEGSYFAQDISQWNTSQVSDMSRMFKSSHFDGDLSGWNVSNVTDMNHMFFAWPMQSDVSQWDVSKVEDMQGMFAHSQMNGDVSRWDVRLVRNFEGMFINSPFQGSLDSWRWHEQAYMKDMFEEFHESVPGYMVVILGQYPLPKNHPRAALFHQLRDLTTKNHPFSLIFQSLDLSPLGAAQFMYREMHQPAYVPDGNVFEQGLVP